MADWNTMAYPAQEGARNAMTRQNSSPNPPVPPCDRARSRQDLTEIILDTLTRVAPEIDPTSLDPGRAFRDQIELDSVDFLNFVLALEKRLDRRIPVVHFSRLSSLDGCLDYLLTGG
jgi:acyl carrier protein